MVMVFLLCMFGEHLPVVRKAVKTENAIAGGGTLGVGDYLYIKTSWSGDNWQEANAEVWVRVWYDGSERFIKTEKVNNDYVRLMIDEKLWNSPYIVPVRVEPGKEPKLGGEGDNWGQAGNKDGYDFCINPSASVTGDRKIKNGTNVLHILGWRDTAPKSNSWVANEWYTPAETVTNAVMKADLNDALKAKVSAGEVFCVKATYFDYLSDKEQKDGWLNNYTLDYDDHSYNDKLVNGKGNKTWFPFHNWNWVISEKAHEAGAKLPMYFGNLYYNHENGYQFGYHNEIIGLYNYYDNGGIHYDTTNTDKAYYDVNNSNALANPNQSIQGLAGYKLDADGDIVFAGTNTKMPYFDKNLLTGSVNKVYAKVIDSYFPFRVTKSGSYNTYSFKSFIKPGDTGTTDNVYFDWSGTTPQKVGYGQGSAYEVSDALNKYGGTVNGCGIFPFNNTAATKAGRGGNDNLDYGFGIRLDIDFKVPVNGTIDGTPGGLPIQFKYTGDDDMFVYFGEQGGEQNLVLDLGGDHKMAEGWIDFKEMKSYVKDSYKDYGSLWSSDPNRLTYTPGSGTEKSTVINHGVNLDPGKQYHMTVFYMERGLAESNFSVEFTLQPLASELFVDNTIEGTVAPSILEMLQKKEEFKYDIKTKDGTEWNNPTINQTYDKLVYNVLSDDHDLTYRNQFGVHNGFELKHSEMVEIGNQMTTGIRLKINERASENELLNYTTRWSLEDFNSGENICRSDGSKNLISHVDPDIKSDRMVEFSLIDPTDVMQNASLYLEYINTLESTDLKFEKNTKTDGGDDFTRDDTYSARVLINLGVDVVHNEGELGFDRYNAPLYSTLTDGEKTALVTAIKNKNYDSADFRSQHYRIYSDIQYTITRGGSEGAIQTLGTNGTIEFKTNDIVTIKNLPKNSGYLIVEDDPGAGYGAGIVFDGKADDTYVTIPRKMTNIYTIPKVNYRVTKTWTPQYGYTGAVPEPADINVQLQRKLETEADSAYTAVSTYTLKKTPDNWTYVFADLDKENTAGIAYIYRVVELDDSAAVVADGDPVTYNTNNYIASYVHDNTGVGATNTSTITNEYIPPAPPVLTTISITKADATNPSVKLDGVVFTLDKVGDPGFATQTKTTNTSGIAEFVDLEDGTYTLTETKTKEGFILLKSPITIVIDRSGVSTVDGTVTAVTTDTLSLTVMNQKAAAFPPTGGMGADLFRLLGLSLILLSAAVYMIATRRGRVYNK